MATKEQRAAAKYNRQLRERENAARESSRGAYARQASAKLRASKKDTAIQRAYGRQASAEMGAMGRERAEAKTSINPKLKGGKSAGGAGSATP